MTKQLWTPMASLSLEPGFWMKKFLRYKSIRSKWNWVILYWVRCLMQARIIFQVKCWYNVETLIYRTWEVKQARVLLKDLVHFSVLFVVSGRELLFLSFCLMLRYLRYLGELFREICVEWYWIIFSLKHLQIYVCANSIWEQGRGTWKVFCVIWICYSVYPTYYSFQQMEHTLAIRTYMFPSLTGQEVHIGRVKCL